MKWTKVDEEVEEVKEEYVMSREEEIEILNRFDPLLIAKMIWREEAYDEQKEEYMMYSDY